MRDLLPDDIDEHEGIPTTTPLRTALDAVNVMPPVLVMRFVEQWATERRLDLDELDRRLHHARGRAGSAQLRRLLTTRELGRVVPDSKAEGDLGALLKRLGLPEPTHHHLVTLPSGATYELDWSYPELLVALELDGYGIHLRSYEAFEGDRWRRNDLVAAGWAVLDFTSGAVRRNLVASYNRPVRRWSYRFAASLGDVLRRKARASSTSVSNSRCCTGSSDAVSSGCH
jgi:hypothetical protein